MRRLITVPLAAAVLLGLAACSSGPSAAGTIEVGANTVTLDVRTAEEYAGGHLEGSQMLDFNGGEVAAAIPSLDPEAEYLVYCRSGNRSAKAADLMRAKGFGEVLNMQGGMMDWQDEGFPVEKGAEE